MLRKSGMSGSTGPSEKALPSRDLAGCYSHGWAPRRKQQPRPWRHQAGPGLVPYGTVQRDLDETKAPM